MGGSADPGGAWAYGRLEVSDGTLFSSIIDAAFYKRFSPRSAQVACRSLGFATGAQMLSGAQSALPGPSGEVDTILAITCTGVEVALAQCLFTPRDYMNDYAFEEENAVALICSDPSGVTPTSGGGCLWFGKRSRNPLLACTESFKFLASGWHRPAACIAVQCHLLPLADSFSFCGS